ncbi:hypothetical protein ACG7TL_001661 [Trametes sanguinea]
MLFNVLGGSILKYSYVIGDDDMAHFLGRVLDARMQEDDLVCGLEEREFCKNYTYEDVSGIHPGVWLEPRQWKQHAMDDELLSVEEDYHVMLKAMDALGHAKSLAICQRDEDGLSEVIPSLSESNSKANVLGVQLHEGENLHAHPADHPEQSVNLAVQRIRELASMEASLHRETKLLPQNPNLLFRAPPVSLDDPPSNLVSNNRDTATFIGLRQWLETQQSCLRSLPPVGHKDADSRRLLMINRTSGWLSALATTERSAWEPCL